MSRRVTALKPQLNRIRAWAHEGSTDAWIAHQLETSAEAVRAFRQEHGIERGGPAPLAPITPDSVVEAMLAEEEAEAAAAELAGEAGADASEPRSHPEPAGESESAPARAPRSRTRKRAAKPAEDAPQAETAVAEDGEVAEDPPVVDAPARGSSRRGARGGAGRRSAAAAAEPQDEQPVAIAEEGEGTSEDEPSRSASSRKRGRRRGRGRGAGRGLEARLLPGSVLLLEPSVAADPAFQEHWQDAGPLRVEIGADAIILRRAATDAEPDRSQS
jgi:hypothetical protein